MCCTCNSPINKIRCSGAGTIYNSINIYSDTCEITKCNNYVACSYCSKIFCGDMNYGCAKERDLPEI